MNGWKLLVVIRISRRILMFHLLILDYLLLHWKVCWPFVCVRVFVFLLVVVWGFKNCWVICQKEKKMNRRHPRTVFVHTPSYSTIQWLVGFFLTTNKFFGEKKVKGGLFVFFLLVVRSVLLWWMILMLFFFNYFLFGWRKNGYFIYI